MLPSQSINIKRGQPDSHRVHSPGAAPRAPFFPPRYSIQSLIRFLRQVFCNSIVENNIQTIIQFCNVQMKAAQLCNRHIDAAREMRNSPTRNAFSLLQIHFPSYLSFFSNNSYGGTTCRAQRGNILSPSIIDFSVTFLYNTFSTSWRAQRKKIFLTYIIGFFVIFLIYIFTNWRAQRRKIFSTILCF